MKKKKKLTKSEIDQLDFWETCLIRYVFSAYNIANYYLYKLTSLYQICNWNCTYILLHGGKQYLQHSFNSNEFYSTKILVKKKNIIVFTKFININ